MPDPLKFAVNLARETGDLLQSYFDIGGIHANRKADHTVITEADLAADALIAAAIKAAFPQDQVLSEEDQTEITDPSQATWVIDPLDGTSNFSLGMPVWGVSIARLVNGYPETAALSFPILGETYSAQRGQGAFLNGSAIYTKPFKPDQPAAFFACCSRTHRHYDISIRYKTRILGAAAYDFCAVARGAAVIGFQSIPKIWDLAAGWLVLEEAGGMVRVHHGPDPFPLSPDTDYQAASYPTMMAADRVGLEEALRSIRTRDKI